MLRYDCAYPAEGRDAGKIEETFDHTKRDKPVIEIETATTRLTPARWNSFLWVVTEIHTSRGWVPFKCADHLYGHTKGDLEKV